MYLRLYINETLICAFCSKREVPYCLKVGQALIEVLCFIYITGWNIYELDQTVHQMGHYYIMLNLLPTLNKSCSCYIHLCLVIFFYHSTTLMFKSWHPDREQTLHLNCSIW